MLFMDTSNTFAIEKHAEVSNQCKYCLANGAVLTYVIYVSCCLYRHVVYKDSAKCCCCVWLIKPTCVECVESVGSLMEIVNRTW